MTQGGPREGVRYPSRGHNWNLPVITIPSNRPLFRLCQTRFPDPAFFGRTVTHRFDSPDRAYGVCYLGTTLDCCLVEVLALDVDATTLAASITSQTLSQHYVAVATSRRDLTLARLVDNGLNQLRIDLRVSSGDDYSVARAWSTAIHDHPSQVDGILYPSRHRNSLYCVALFERARETLQFTIWGILGDQRTTSLWVETARVLAECDIRLL